ncbi:hypothetical protein LCGC14_1888220 [marine sediment metagenome]|uniref:DNA recombination protein RmuC n=1 Tax=marine sediment metagenome TaxID=412755 RepID=A0A0F9G0G7_9ZZZZ
MNDYSMYLLIGLGCLAIGYFIGNYIQSLQTKATQSALLEREQQLNQNLRELNQRLLDSNKHRNLIQLEKERLGNQIIRYQADLEHLEKKIR